MRVALFVPCYIDAFFPEVGIATLELLERLGCTVEYPLDQTCCGQPMANSCLLYTSTWWGLIAPAGTPRPLVTRLNAAFVAALESADIKERFGQLLAEPVPSTPELFAALIKRELARYEGVVKASGAKAD